MVRLRASDPKVLNAAMGASVFQHTSDLLPAMCGNEHWDIYECQRKKNAWNSILAPVHGQLGPALANLHWLATEAKSCR
jgi:hypothetical protein